MKIHFTPFFIFIITFMGFTVVGALSHEYGHIAVSRLFGFETILHYASAQYQPKGFNTDEHILAIDALLEAQRGIPYASWPQELKDEYKTHQTELEQKYSYANSTKRILITAAGPVQTMLTGMVGLFILWRRKKTIRTHGFKTIDWLAVFLSLFWLREACNLIMAVASEVIRPNGNWFSGDEARIAMGLQLWSGTFSVPLGCIGFAVAIYVVFYVIPKHLRFTFIASGCIGGVVGFINWMYYLGPWLLP